MTAQDFIAKWSQVDLTERAAAQQHFLDLCELVGHPKPAAADPTGVTFTFEKGAAKHGGGDGWADVWKKDFFGWEYKGKKKNLDAAYDQLLEYRADLENPPLLVVCDMDIIRVHTNFNNAPTRTHEITLATLDQPRNLEILRNVFFAPDKLRPGVTSEAITEKASGHFAEIAESMRQRGLEPQAVAHFLVRVVFCLFAEDVGLLERGLFTRLVTRTGGDPKKFARHVGELFSVMATGGDFLLEPIRHFNGSLFDAGAVLELTAKEIAAIGTAAGEDWSAVDVSISGTLFERGLNPAKRTQQGAHYTGRTDIETIVEPVVLAPLRREWADVRAQAGKLLNVESGSSRGDEAQTSKISEFPHVVSYKNKTARKSRATAEKLVLAFLERLKTVRVLDPAGGSGNFLFVTLQKLLDLERDVNHFLRERGFTPQFPQVGPLQLHYIEIDPYAHDLAQTVVWIGYIQWLRANGYGYPAEPILKPMGANFLCADALFTDWPEVDFIVSNPPFLGDKLMRGKLGGEYVEKLRKLFAGRIPGQSDLCCYWFEKARELIEHGKCQRAGLLATQGIRGGANREVLKRIKETGDIFFAVSDREWVLDGANVHVSMIGFDSAAEKNKSLNGKSVSSIEVNLSEHGALPDAQPLQLNSETCFLGIMKAGAFDIDEQTAVKMLLSPNPHSIPNSEVLRPRFTARDILQRTGGGWIVDFGCETELDAAAKFQEPFRQIEAHVKPERIHNRRKSLADYWWIHGEPRPGLRKAIAGLDRFILTPEVSKHRIFVWMDAVNLADHQTRVFARSDDYFFGVLHSRLHEVWALAQGTQLREKESGFRYTPTTCFETFPFPFADDLAEPLENLEAELNAAKHYAHIVLCEEPVPYRTSSSRREEALTKKSKIEMSLVTSAATSEQLRAAIAAAAQELNELRERWLNPPEWTVETILEFPASVDGPWSRYVDCGGKRSATPLSESSATQSAVAATALPAQSKIGLARYPRLVPKDADCAAKLKKRTLTNLYNERPTWLANAHKKLDAAVAAAYGFPADLSDEQILEKLLALNLERAAEQAKAAKVKTPKAQLVKHAKEML